MSITYCPQLYQTEIFQKQYLLKSVKIYPVPHKVEQPILPISAIPLIRTNVANNADLRRKLAIRGDKYFVTMSASGSDTVEILKALLKMKKVHISRKFEYDPYLCGESGIRYLRKINNRLRRVKEANYVLRRLDRPNETNGLFESLHKIKGLEKFRMELISTLDINDCNYKNLISSIHGKALCLKTCDLNIHSLQNVSEQAVSAAHHIPINMRKLENLSVSIIKRQSFEHSKKVCKGLFFKPHQKIKNFSTVFGVASNGWSAATSNNCPVAYTLALGNAINPEKLQIKFISAKFHVFSANAIVTMLSQQTNARDFSIDIVGSELEDIVVVEAVKELVKVLHLEKITFKITQRPSDSNLAGEAIVEIIDTMSKAAHLKKFDIYLRNIFLEPREKKEVDLKLASLAGDIKFKHLERSLHLYKN